MPTASPAAAAVPEEGDSRATSRPRRTRPDTQTVTREAIGLAALDTELRQIRYQANSEDKRRADPGREWDGTFGSYPLHDDYGDESGTEEVE